MSARLSNRLTIVLVAAIIAVALALNPFGSPVSADHQPADKIAVAGSTVEFLRSDGEPFGDEEEGDAPKTVALFEGRLRASTPTDLIISVTAECALWTDILTVGNDDSSALARVVVWVEMNPDRDTEGAPTPETGNVVGVTGDDPDGRVVFCDRLYQRITRNFDDEEIETYNRTRSANAFNWISLNVGNGIHDVVVFAELEAEADANVGEAFAKAGVGKRTLTVQPVKLANDVTI